MGLRPLTSSTNPVSLADAKAHLRIDGTDDDSTLTAYLDAALNYVEIETRQCLCTRDFLLSLDDFPQERFIKMPRPPLQAVSSVTYTDAAGAQQTLDPSTYIVDAVSMPGRIVLKPTQSWPQTDHSANCVQVMFTAGYGTEAADVPAGLLQTVKLYAGHLYENREAATDRRIDAVPLAVDSLIQQAMFPEAVG